MQYDGKSKHFYIGYFKDDEFDGYGKQTFDNDDVKEGYFKNDVLDGFGKVNINGMAK